MNIETFTSLFGWMTVINIIFLLFTTLAIIVMRERVVKIHADMFVVKESEITPIYFRYLANYKLLILVFNLAPYIALKFIA